MRQIKLAVLLCSALALAIPAGIALHQYLFVKVPILKNANLTRSRMIHLAYALESYHADHDAYPAWSDGEQCANAGLPAGSPYAGMPSFRQPQGPGDRLATLTTPVAYLAPEHAAHMQDLFSGCGAKYAYWTPAPRGVVEPCRPDGWIIWSPAPDTDFDITDPAAVYSAFGSAPSDALIQLSYDPSNGTTSSGDVYRVKQ